MLPSDHQKAQGGIGGPKPSDARSQTSDMCGGLRKNFEEILSLPEQTAAKGVAFCSVAREKLNKVASATLLTHRGGRNAPLFCVYPPWFDMPSLTYPNSYRKNPSG